MKRRKPIVIPGDGDPCPRCGVPMQIREPDGIGDRQRHQRFFLRTLVLLLGQAMQDNVGHARAVQSDQCGLTPVHRCREEPPNPVCWADIDSADLIESVREPRSRGCGAMQSEQPLMRLAEADKQI